MKTGRTLHVAASWEETGRGPATWPFGLDEDVAAAGAAGVAGVLRSASPCGLVPVHQSQDDASWRSSHRCLYHLGELEDKDHQGEAGALSLNVILDSLAYDTSLRS